MCSESDHKIVHSRYKINVKTQTLGFQTSHMFRYLYNWLLSLKQMQQFLKEVDICGILFIQLFTVCTQFFSFLEQPLNSTQIDDFWTCGGTPAIIELAGLRAKCCD